MSQAVKSIKKLLDFKKLDLNFKWLVAALVLVVASIAIALVKHQKIEAARSYQEKLMWQAFYADSETKSQAALELLAKTKLAAPKAVLLNLKQASSKVVKKDFAGALRELEEVLKQREVPAEFKTLAIVRMIRILSELKRAEEGFKLLEANAAYLPSLVKLELKGDLYLIIKQPRKARECYLEARESKYLTLDSRQRLTLKLLDT